jgi:iron complex transport system substrate-binding protein
VGWGTGEDEDARVQSSGLVQPWGFFVLSKISTQQAANSWKLAGRIVRSWVLRCSLFAVSSLVCVGPGFADDTGQLVMKRRQQGILTGMPFMAHVSERSFVDDLGRRIYLAKAPSRIVSLAPSITELLFAVKLDEQIVGVTEFCDYPPAAASRTKVGYSHPNLEILASLQPDLVLAPQEFLRADIQAKLEQLKIPIFILDPKTLDDIPLHIQTLGRIAERSTEASALAQTMRQRIAEIKRRTATLPPKRVLYVLNSQPLITVGPGSFIHHMIGVAGGVNVAAQATVPYPRLSMETVLKEDPEVLVFPTGAAEAVSRSEQEQWQRWTSLSAVKQGRFHEVPSNLLNRPGPRIVEGLEELAKAIHPEAFGAGTAMAQP